LDKARSVLGGLRLGQYSTPITDMLIHFERFDAAENSIYLTNIDHTHLDWWQSEEGRKYWQANLNALDRGVDIERVFIYDTLTPALENLIREHATTVSNGRRIEVLAVQKDVLPDELRADIAIWDESGIESAGSWDKVALLLAGPTCVRDLLVEGRRVVAGGQMTTIDLPLVVERQNQLARRLMG